jgi:DNA-binding transcriptional LysR family regulator
MKIDHLVAADLNLFVLFDAVLRERHVGRAAKRLGLTQSAVSHGLTRLRRLLHDPLFLRVPKGVVPTARASALAEPIAELLARARGVLASAEPFDAARSVRRFNIGAPDDVSAVFLPTLLARLRRIAPNIDLSVRQLLPLSVRPVARAWEPVLDELEAGSIDLAIAPLANLPARFLGQTLWEEDFVIAMRKRHPFARHPTLDHYCEHQHVVVSMTGDSHGLFDELLAQQKRSRRVALTVPNFMQSLAHLAGSDLIAALPRRLVTTYAARFGLTYAELPIRRPRDGICAVATRAALQDPGVAWLFDLLGTAAKQRASR